MTSRSRRPRLVLLVTSSGAGGAEVQVIHLATEMARRGWEVGVISMLALEPPLIDLPSAGVKTASLEMGRGVPDPRAMLRLRTLLREWKPDVLHGHMVHANLMARLSRLLRSTPVLVSTMHNQDEGAQWRYLAYRVTDRLSDFTSTVSRIALDEAVRRGAAPQGRLVVVPNGIPMAAYDMEPAVRENLRRSLDVSDGFVWLTVGRLVEAKCHRDLIEAFGLVHADHSGSRLLIAGAGPLEEPLVARIRDAGLADVAKLLGPRRDVPQLMQAADAFAMSSLWEGLPMVLLEAGASALPIAATDVGGSQDAVVDGTTGYLVPAGSPERLAEAMRRVMDLSPAQRAAMGQAGRTHIGQAFDLDTVVDLWESIYRDLLGARMSPIDGASAPMRQDDDGR